MYLRNETKTTNNDSTRNSRLRYTGNHHARKAPGQITPFITRPSPSAPGSSHTEEVTYQLKTARAWSEWRHSLLHNSQDQHITSDPSNSEQRHLPSLPKALKIHIPLERFIMETDTETDSAPSVSGPVSREAPGTGYVAALRQRQTGIPLVRDKPVRPPRIVISPPTPTIVSFESPLALNYLFLSPPPPCHKRKDRKRQSERDAAKFILLRNRNRAFQNDWTSENKKQAGTAHSANAEPQKNEIRGIQREMAPHKNEQPKIGGTDDTDSLEDSESSARKEVIQEKYELADIEDIDITGSRGGSPRHGVVRQTLGIAENVPTADFVSCRVEATRSNSVQFEDRIIAKLQRLGF